MTEEQLNKIFQQAFETENGKIVLENLQRVILETTPFSQRAEDTTTDSLLRDGARELYNYILSRVREEITNN
jgi:hypothetical protein